MKEKTIKIKNMEVPVPEKECDDINCPFHGNLPVKGRMFTGTVKSAKMNKSCTVQWDRKIYFPKYERYGKKRTKVTAHNPPCINAQEGDVVTIIQTRPLSKTKNYVVIKK